MSTAAPPPATEIQYAARQLAEGRPQEAIAVLERLSRDFPAYVSAQVLLAKSYQTTGRNEEALAAWHEAYQLMPGSPLIVRQRQRLLEGDWQNPITPQEAPAESPRQDIPQARTTVAEPPPLVEPPPPVEPPSAAEPPRAVEPPPAVEPPRAVEPPPATGLPLAAEPPRAVEPPPAAEPPPRAAEWPLDPFLDGPDEAEKPLAPTETSAQRGDLRADAEQEKDISKWDEPGGVGEPDPFDSVGRRSFSPGSARVPDEQPAPPAEPEPQIPTSQSREEEEEDSPWVDLEPTETAEFVVPGEGWRLLGEEDFSAARKDRIHEVEVTPPDKKPRSSRPRAKDVDEGEDDWSPFDSGHPDASARRDEANFDASDDWLDVQGDLTAEGEGAEDILQQSEDLDSLIEQLENAPRIKPEEDPFARAGDTELNHEVVTVTLARIYENQKQFTAAAHVYERLAQEEPQRAEEFRLKADEMRRLAQS